MAVLTLVFAAVAATVPAAMTTCVTVFLLALGILGAITDAFG